MNDAIKKACDFIVQCDDLPTLGQVAKHVGYSPSHFQRLFTRLLGISPRHYADVSRREHFKKALRKGEAVSSALYGAGFGSSSRVYEFANRYLGMTPREYQRGGLKKRIWYEIVACPLGKILIAATTKGICAVRIGDNKDKLRSELNKEFHAASLIEKSAGLKKWTQALVNYLAGKSAWPMLPYDVKATAFQRKVWEWLRTIPPGKTYYYSEVAKAIGEPKAVRAVARACASNQVALVIPCHRIVPKSGGIGGYRWNPKRKRKLLDLETRR